MLPGGVAPGCGVASSRASSVAEWTTGRETSRLPTATYAGTVGEKEGEGERERAVDELEDSFLKNGFHSRCCDGVQHVRECRQQWLTSWRGPRLVVSGLGLCPVRA